MQQQSSGAADQIAKSSALLGRTAPQPSWALGLARRKFSIGVLAPKMVPTGSVSDTYSPMPVPESAEETPKKCPDQAKSSALLGAPPFPPTMWVGLGGDGRARPPHAAYIYYICKRENSRPSQFFTFWARKVGARWSIVSLGLQNATRSPPTHHVGFTPVTSFQG